LSINILKFNNEIKFSVNVVPKSSKNSLSLLDEGIIKLKIKAPPVDGKANKACVEFIAECLKVSKSQVKIVSGLQSKTKTVVVSGDPEILSKMLLELLIKE